MPKTLSRPWALAALLVLTAACGSDDGAAPSAPGDSPPPADVSPSSDCPATELTVTNHTTGDTATATAAAARTVRPDALYTLDIASFELDTDELTRRFRVAVPEGEHLVQVQMTAFNLGEGDDLPPLTVGTEIVPVFGQSGVTTFVVAHHTHDQSYERAREDETTGRLAITGLGEVICVEINYTDADKTVTGTIRAPVIE